MSNKELCIKLIDSFEEDQLKSVFILLQGAKNLASNSSDDEYCLQLLEDYENDTDPTKGELTSMSDFAKELGIELK